MVAVEQTVRAVSVRCLTGSSEAWGREFADGPMLRGRLCRRSHIVRLGHGRASRTGAEPLDPATGHQSGGPLRASRLLDELRLQIHRADAVDLAGDVVSVAGVGQADALDLGAAFDDG